MRQETLTIVARVVGAPPFADLRAALDQIATDRVPGPGARPALFADPKLGIHFARLVLLEEPVNAEYGSSLIFESNFDTALDDEHEASDAHLALLCERIGEPLCAVFRHCAGFTSELGSAALAEALSEHRVSASAAYQGHTQRDLPRIRLEQRLREVLIDFFLERQKPLRASSITTRASTCGCCVGVIHYSPV